MDWVYKYESNKVVSNIGITFNMDFYFKGWLIIFWWKLRIRQYRLPWLQDGTIEQTLEFRQLKHIIHNNLLLIRYENHPKMLHSQHRLRPSLFGGSAPPTMAIILAPAFNFHFDNTKEFRKGVVADSEHSSPKKRKVRHFNSFI